MSVILAFGLSPLGQVPAYADEGVTTQATIESQATQPTEDNGLTQKFKLFVNDVTYDGGKWFGGATDAVTGATTTDRLLKNRFVSVYTVDSNGDRDPFTAANIIYSKADSVYKFCSASTVGADDANVLFTLEFQDEQGVKIKDADGIENAGTYKVVLTGKNGYQGDKVTSATFEVKPYDISKLKLDDDGTADGSTTLTKTPVTMNYMGKAQSVYYKKFPTVVEAANVNEIAYGSTAASTEKVPVADFPIKALKAGDFDFNPPTVVDRTKHDVELVGKGNFTGKQTVRVTVGTGVFATADNLTVNGAVNNANYKITGDFATAAQTLNGTVAAGGTVPNPMNTTDPAVTYTPVTTMNTIDLKTAKANPTVLDSDPAATGKVVFGEKVLTKDSDYTVTYYKGGLADANVEKSAPTEVGTDYFAVIKYVGSDCAKNAGQQVVVRYDITMGTELDEVARVADFGSASYVGVSDGYDTDNFEYDTDGTVKAGTEVNHVTADSRTVLTPGALAFPATAKFFNATGADVSTAVGDNYEIVSVEKWTEADEKLLLGEAGYEAKYPHSDAPYENTDAVNEFFDDSATGTALIANGGTSLGDTVKEADVFTDNAYTDPTKNAKTLGFNGLPAGDYKLTVQGAKNFTDKGQVYGKFTIAPAEAAAGAAAGQISITAGNKGLDSAGKVIKDKGNPVVKMAEGTNVATGKAEFSHALTPGSPYEVRTGQADYYVTYYQGGQEVTVDSEGTYDAVFTFGGRDFTGSISMDAALTVGKAELADVYDWVDVDRTYPYLYTGSAVTPKLVFWTVSDATYAITKSWTYESANEARTWKTVKGNYDKALAAHEKSGTATTLANLKLAKADVDTYLTQAVTDTKAKKVTNEKDKNYSATFRGLTNETSVSSGKAVGPGSYDVVISGAGDYVTTADESGALRTLRVTSLENTFGSNSWVATTGFTVAPLELNNTKIGSSAYPGVTDPYTYTTVQFKDGDNWTEDYSVAVDAADKNPEPEFRLVTTATKSDENPVVIPKGLYTGKYDYSALKADNTGTVSLVLTPVSVTEADMTAYVNKTTYTGDPATVNDDHNGAGSFTIAAGTFEGAGAALDLGGESADYSVDGQDLKVKVKIGTTELAPQYSVANATTGQYVWTIAREDGNAVNGVKEVKSSAITGDTEQAASLNASNAIKSFVKDAGKYTVTITGGASAQYAGKLTGTFEVTPKEITSTDAKLKVTFLGAENDNEYGYEGAKRTVLTTGATADGSGKYSGSVYYKDEDTNADATDADNGYFTYVKDSDVDKASGNAYRLEGNTGTDAGTYSAKITFLGNYKGTVEKTWKITPVNIGTKITAGDSGAGYRVLADDLMLADRNDLIYKDPTQAQSLKNYYHAEYDSTEHHPTVTVYEVDAAGKIGDTVKGLEVTYLYDNATNATPGRTSEDYYADAAVTIVASGGNYTGRVTKYFPITPLAIGGDRVKVEFSDEEITWTGKPVEPKGTLTYALQDGKTFTLTPDKDYTVTYTGTDMVSAGSTVTAKFTGLAPNFVGGNETFVTKDFTIKAAQLDQEITANVAKVAPVYGKTGAVTVSGAQGAIKATVTNGTGKATVTSIKDGKVTIKGTKAGSATLKITAEATENYKASNEIVIPVTVTKAANTLKVAKVTRTAKGVSKAKKVVAGLKVAKKGQGTVTYKKVKVNKNAKKFTVNKKTGKIAIAKGTKAGTYKVTVSAKAAGNGNYKASALKKAVVTVKVKK